MKRTILLLALILNFIISAFSQPGYHFFGGAGDDGFIQIAEASDGNLILLGTKTENSIPKIWLQKITQDGQLIWEKSFKGSDSFSDEAYGIRLKIEEDGSILVLGAGRFGYGTEFLKTTSDGALIWHQGYDDSLYDFEKKGTNYYLVGKREVPGTTNLGYVAKTNTTGNLVDSKTYNYDDRNDAKSIFKLNNSDKFLVFGRLDRTGAGDSYIFSAEMDESLNLTNDKKTVSGYSFLLFGFLEDFSQAPLAATYQTQEDDFWITTSNPTTVQDHILLINFDSKGIIKSRKDIPLGSLNGDFNRIEPFSINLLKDKSMLITGYIYDFSLLKAFAMKVSPEGNMIWTKIFNPGSESIITSSIETSCGRIFLTGVIERGNNLDGMMIEISQTGESSFHNVFIDTTVCIENPITIRGQVFDETGTYQLRFPDVNNPDQQCDTTINLNLTIADIHAPKIECFVDTFINSIAIEWEAVPLTEGYKIFINGDSVTTQTFESYLHVLNSPGETIQFEVVPFNSTGCRFYSSIAECSATSDASNIMRLKNQISVIPNPSSGVFQFQTDFQLEQVEVLDSFGKLLFNSKDSSIDLSEQVSGLYFFKIKTSEGTVLKKGVKI